MDYEEDFSSVVSHTVSVTHFTRHNRKEFRTKNSATSGRPCNALCQSKSCKKVHLSLRAGGHLEPLQIHGSLDPYFFIPNSMSIVLSHSILAQFIVVTDRQTGRHTQTHTHSFNGPFSGTTQVSRYQKGKTNLDFTEARDSECQRHQLEHMQVCTSLQTDNHASTSPLSFFLLSISIFVSNELETKMDMLRRSADGLSRS